MKVILLKEVKTLGKEREVVEVSDGYAENFLFPQNLAIQATANALRKLKEQDQSVEKQSKRELAKMAALAKSLEGFELVLAEKVSDGGRFYSSVNAKTVADALRKANFDVVEKMVDLPNPLKEPGEHRVTINLPSGFEAEILLRLEAK